MPGLLDVFRVSLGFLVVFGVIPGLVAFASPKVALTWASTFAEASDATPAPSISRRFLTTWIVAALAVLTAVGAMAWWTLRAPAPIRSRLAAAPHPHPC